MKKPKNLWDVDVVRERFSVALHALIHGNKSATARKFEIVRKTVRRHVGRFERYRETGDLRVFLNRPRGDPQRTPEWIEDEVVRLYQEEDTERTCPNIARKLEELHGVSIVRQTVRNILIRRDVWEPTEEQRPIRRFQEDEPNALWQIDLIEKAQTDAGEVYAVVIVDDHSRYLITLRFLPTKEAEGVLQALYQAFCQYGLPAKILCDRGSQFFSSFEDSMSRFQEILDRLGVEIVFTSRPQTKGKVEKLIQFIERDFLNVHRHRVDAVKDFNDQTEDWCQMYNERLHEGIYTNPQERYAPSPCQVDRDALWLAFAQEDRRKVYRDSTVRFSGGKYKVPNAYIGSHVWVQVFAGEMKVRAGFDDKVIATHSLYPSGDF